MVAFWQVLKTNSGRLLFFSVQAIIIKWTKSTYPVSFFLHLEDFRPRKISLTLLSQDSINEFISPRPEPSLYLLKTQFQERPSVKKINE